MEKIIATEISPTGIDGEILVQLEKNQKELGLKDAVVYYGFPVFKDYEDSPVKSKFAILSKNHGIILIYTTNKHEIERDDESLSQLFSHLESTLKKSKVIRVSKKSLAIELNSFLFFNESFTKPYESENAIIDSYDSIADTFNDICQEEFLDDHIFNEARSIIEGAKAINRAQKRQKTSDDPTSKSNILIELEKEIANFDIEQRKIAISMINGPQRIRGLAGSGKTVVLAMKAAHIHLQHPDKKILFTFYTKSLYGQIKDLIARFYRHFTGEEPNWDNIHVLHSWGGNSIEGVYFRVCIDNNIPFIKFSTAKNEDYKDPFAYVCRELIKNKIEKKYNYILIDEAQDLPNEFFKVCYELAEGESGEKKNIVWAYDELQSIFNVYSRQPKELFGVNSTGIAKIDLDIFRKNLQHGQINDFVLHRCYRNPLEVLLVAHALGFGIYSKNPVQTLENKEHWRDFGYSIEDEITLAPGTEAIITRERVNSPLSIYNHQTPKEIIKFFRAENFKDECDWIISNIEKSIKEGLNAHDILVISLDDRNAKTYFTYISKYLAQLGIHSNNLSISSSAAPPFQIEDMVTLSTVHKAKGNEAAMVFAIGIDWLYEARNTLNDRNKLFTAFTRTKAWLRISGMGDRASFFFSEIEQSLKNSPSLVFKVPDPNQVKPIERDLQTESAELLRAIDAVDNLRNQGMTEKQIQMALNLKGDEDE